ncbi:MAG TPA: copper resistance protein CopC [Gaiellaceae bacterium]|nr:copper resistance protein CopC [Gaiellaceae bacterium]
MRRALALGAVAAAALALPAAASAHAVLLKTFPEASAELDRQPQVVRLTFSEQVEPRFAIVSVTDADARGQTDGSPRRSATDPYTLEVPVHRLAQGWYLVFWRAISADGHPVRGAFTFDIGPNPGPAPEFSIPPLSETAATPSLLVARWLAFLLVMASLGLFVLRAVVARPLVGRVSGTRLRAVSTAFLVVLALALVAVPAYVVMATARFALRPVWDVGAALPLMSVSAFGRGFLDLELMLALFAAAALATLWLDRPERPRRSLAALFGLWGALLAGGAVLLAPGAAGHAAQTSPRPLAIALDWLHLAAGSLWLGGLLGLLVLWRSLPAAKRTAGLAVCVPRFSNTAFGSVLVLVGSGTGAALLHLPTLGSLWQTGYGKAVLAKVLLLACALLLAAVNLLRTAPALAAPEVDAGTARLLRRLVGGEAVLVAATVFAAAVLTSLPPPAKALAHLGTPSAHTGPGPVSRTVTSNGYTLQVLVRPNRVGLSNDFAVRLLRDGRPVDGATVTATFTMLDMEMPTQSYVLAGRGSGRYERQLPALVMVGRWALAYDVQPPQGAEFRVLLVDRANG